MNKQSQWIDMYDDITDINYNSNGPKGHDVYTFGDIILYGNIHVSENAQKQNH